MACRRNLILAETKRIDYSHQEHGLAFHQLILVLGEIRLVREIVPILQLGAEIRLDPILVRQRDLFDRLTNPRGVALVVSEIFESGGERDSLARGAETDSRRKPLPGSIA